MPATLTIYDLGRTSSRRRYLITCDSTGESDRTTTMGIGITGAVSQSFTVSASVLGDGSTALYYGEVEAGGSGQIVISASIVGVGSASKSINLASSASDGSTTANAPTRVTSGVASTVGIYGNASRTYELRAYTTMAHTNPNSVNLSSTYFTVATGLSASSTTWHDNSFTVTDQQMAQLVGPTESTKSVLLFVVARSAGKIVSAGFGTATRENTTLSTGPGFWPTVGGISLSDEEGHYGKYGVYVQGHSVIKASASVEAKYGASITSYSFSAEDGSTDLKSQGASGTQVVGTPTVAGERRLHLVVTDSRGNTQGGAVTFRVGAYRAPEITELYAARWSGTEEDDSSDTVRISLTGSVCVINDVAASGTATFRARENAQGTDWTGLGVNEVAGNFGTTTRDATAQDVETSFVYQVVLEDEFGTQATAEAQVGTVRPIIDFSVGGEAIGFWTAAAEREYKDGDPARGIFLDNDLILSEGRCVSGSGAGESGELVYDRLMRASYNYATDSFLIELLQHAVLANGKHLSAMNASGSVTRLLGINSSGRTELNWTSGGLGGRAFKQIWSGTWSTGSITVGDAPYYNVFGFVFGNGSAQTWTGIGFRYNSIIKAYSFGWNSDSAPIVSTSCSIVVSGTRLTMQGKASIGLWLNSWSLGSTQSNMTIDRIYGLI